MAHIIRIRFSFLGSNKLIGPLYRKLSSSSQLYAQFKPLQTTVDQTSEQFKRNKAWYDENEAVYQKLLGLAVAAGGEKGIQRHTQVNIS